MLITIFVVSFFVILAILTFFRNVLLAVLSTVLSLFRRKDKNSAQSEPKIRHNMKRKKKIFDENEGEYVEYEEVKK